LGRRRILRHETADPGGLHARQARHHGRVEHAAHSGFSERNLFDALFDTLDRVDRIEGKKYVILISSGHDSFSRLTLDQITKKIKSTKDVTIYSISIGWQHREFMDASGRAGGIRELTWLQDEISSKLSLS